MLNAIKDYIPQPISNTFTEFLQEDKKLRLYAAAVATVFGTIKLVGYIQKHNRRKKWNAVGKDVVVLHTMQRGKLTPSLSPFALKLETYLRMADIPYEVDYTEPMGPKGKLPWITLNGESIGDSQLIIEKLGRKFGKDFSAHLTPKEVGVAQAMRIMTEEHFLWCLEIWMFEVDGGASFPKVMNFPASAALFFGIMMLYYKRTIKNVTYTVGVGRHSKTEVEEMGKKDIAALATWLGNKPFFMGDEPTEVDCTIFGFLAQLVWNFPQSPYGKMVQRDYSNLINYCQRMKEKFWPDWNDHLDP